MGQGMIPEGVAFLIHIPAGKAFRDTGNAFHHPRIVPGHVGIVGRITVGDGVPLQQLTNEFSQNQFQIPQLPLKCFFNCLLGMKSNLM